MGVTGKCYDCQAAQMQITDQLFGYTPISIKVASEKNDAWSMFHSPQCIIVASLVNYVPATSLDT